MTKVARIPYATISINVEMELLLKGLVNKDGSRCKLMESELVQIFDKLAKLSTLSIRNMISDARQFYSQGGYIDNILKFKKSLTYDFTHNNDFSSQGSHLIYLFKMSICSVRIGVDLVKKMQPRGDLENVWVMFDHVKRVKE